MSAHLAADLAVTLESDRPGALAKALGCVSAAGINIDGYTEMNGVVHVLTTDLPATRRCLHDAAHLADVFRIAFADIVQHVKSQRVEFGFKARQCIAR